VSFVPAQRRFGSPVSAYRTVLFWLMMIALAFVLWQMSSKSESQSSGQNAQHSISYSDFMNDVDQNNVATVKLLLSQNTAEIHGTLRQPTGAFSVTIPKEVIPELTDRLRKQNVAIEVSEIKEANWLNLVMTVAPILIIVGFWIFMMRNRQGGQSQPAGSPPSSGPIGD
jgi:cell division protease FtsH